MAVTFVNVTTNSSVTSLIYTEKYFRIRTRSNVAMAAHREVIQKQIHQDWANREYIEVITASIKRITDFLNSFGE